MAYLLRRPRNKLGFALQLCVLRHPGRLLAPGEFVPPAVVDFIGRQLDLAGDELADYAVRSETRHDHLAELRRLYGFRSLSGGAARELGDRLREEAEQAQSNEDLVRRFVEACRGTRTILPATTTIERLCADALVAAERRIEARIAERVPPRARRMDAAATRCEVSTTTSVQYRLSRAEYEHAVAAGVFGDRARIELVDGELHAMTPEGTRHTTAIDLASSQLARIFHSNAYLRIQHPLATGEDSEPEPDIAVVTGTIRDYENAHPTSALLVVEVSDESLERDRTVKQRLYARCGIVEYWIIAIPERTLEIHRDPGDDGYKTITRRTAGDTVSPLARPNAAIAVVDLLPHG